MPLPSNMKKLLPASNEVLANYDYVDIANGTGVTKFYAGLTGASGAYTYSLSNNTFTGAGVAIEGTANTGEGSLIFYQSLDLDFDIMVNSQRLLKGDVIVNVPIAFYDAGGWNIREYCLVKLRKYSGTTETEIASASGALLRSDGIAAGYRSLMEAIRIPVTTGVSFKKGDTIRITTELWAGSARSPLGAFRTFLACDPMEREDAAFAVDMLNNSLSTPTSLSALIPFRIDI